MYRWFIIIASFLLLSESCDEFILKKSVEIKYLNVSLSFDEVNEKINGTVKCIIENNQTTKLKEIYFFCNQNTFVSSIKYKNNTIFFDNAFLYGYHIYRIKIPDLEPGKKEEAELTFSIIGPSEKSRFILKRDFVFLDPKEIWLPLPFLSSQKFNYTINAKLPKDYYLITGGKLSLDSVSNEFRIQQFESETDEAIESGVIIITKSPRYNKNKIYIYTKATSNADEFILQANNINNFFSKKLGFMEFSQIHLLDNIFQYNDMSVTIEGETFANVILISNIPSKELSPETLNYATTYNYIYEDSEIQKYKNLAHEIAHSHLFGKITFELDNYLILESIVEYLALLYIKEVSFPVYNTFLLQNRFNIQNLINSKQNEAILNFLYRVNYLDAIFSENKSLYFELLKILDKKYRYTKISLNEIVQTIKDLPFEVDKKFEIDEVNISSAEKINQTKLYNSFINWNTKVVTNKISRRKIKIERLINVNINDNYPFKVKAHLISEYKNYSITNLVILNNSETNIIFKEKPFSVKLTSPFDMLEENLYDNYIFFEKNITSIIEESLNYYYSGQKSYIPKNVEFIKEFKENKLQYERSFNDDRELTWELKGKIRFVVDVFKQNKNDIYIQAFKLINNKFFSYVIIKGNVEDKKINLVSIIDPNL